MTKLSDAGWKEEIARMTISTNAKQKLSAAIAAKLGRRSFSLVTANEFISIIDDVFFLEFAPSGKRYLLERNKEGRLELLVSE